MDERELRGWIERVKDGTISRRQFAQMMVGLGLTAPMAAQMLASGGGRAGPAEARLHPDSARGRRGAEDGSYRLAQLDLGRVEQAQGDGDHRVGLELLAPGLLAQGTLTWTGTSRARGSTGQGWDDDQPSMSDQGLTATVRIMWPNSLSESGL